MVSQIGTYGLFINQPNHVAAAEAVIFVGFYSWVSFAYVSLLQRKLWNARLGGFAKNYIGTEILDNALHLAVFLICDFTKPPSVFLAFEGCHLFTSVMQYKIRWSLLGFALRTSHLYTAKTQWLIAMLPYGIRLLMLAVGIIVYTQGYYHVTLPVFIGAEFTSILYDLVLVEYAHYLLANRSSGEPSMKEFIWYVLNFDHLLLYSLLLAGVALVIIGEFTPGIFYLQPLGAVIMTTAYYTMRSFLVSHIENWLTHQHGSTIDLPSSRSKPSRPKSHIGTSQQAARIHATASLSALDGPVRQPASMNGNAGVALPANAAGSMQKSRGNMQRKGSIPRASGHLSSSISAATTAPVASYKEGQLSPLQSGGHEGSLSEIDASETEP